MLIQALNWLCGVDSCVQVKEKEKAKLEVEVAYADFNNAHQELRETSTRATLATASVAVGGAAVGTAISQFKKKVESGEHVKVKQ